MYLLPSKLRWLCKQNAISTIKQKDILPTIPTSMKAKGHPFFCSLPARQSPAYMYTSSTVPQLSATVPHSTAPPSQFQSFSLLPASNYLLLLPASSSFRQVPLSAMLLTVSSCSNPWFFCVVFQSSSFQQTPYGITLLIFCFILFFCLLDQFCLVSFFIDQDRLFLLCFF
ncbi:hypothetical protein KSP39_PZI017477 [Platanthera zijinensis]|uniref:Uncharacterized protein n=1 Tax=Platanthera zijinensis TaxID=2320716 RepID=A0AAP0B5Z9_9ASPA